TEIIQSGDCLSRGKKLYKLIRRDSLLTSWRISSPPGVLAIHGIGSGKTLTAVVTSQCHLEKHPDSKVVVITPASLQANFKQELYEYSAATENDKRHEFYTYDSYAN